MAPIKRYEVFLVDDFGQSGIEEVEYEFGEYVKYWDHLAAMEELQDQIKALSIKQAPY